MDKADLAEIAAEKTLKSVFGCHCDELLSKIVDWNTI